MTATVDKERVYVGEQLTVTYVLYTRRTLRNIGYGRLPAYTGFWSETLFDAQRASFDREIYNGREYRVMRLKTMALFPAASESRPLTSLKSSARYRTARGAGICSIWTISSVSATAVRFAPNPRG